MKQKYKCCECGIKVLRYPSQATNKLRVFCSQVCVGKSKQHGDTLFCALCDAPFYRRVGEQDKGIRVNQFCSKACYSEWRSEHKSDTNYPKINGRHEHRIVAEAVLGRALKRYEVVHHIDSNKQNNHPSNLAVFPTQSIHARCHFGEMSKDELRKFSLVKV